MKKLPELEPELTIELTELYLLGHIRSCRWCKASGSVGGSNCFECHGYGSYYRMEDRNLIGVTMPLPEALRYRRTQGHWPGALTPTERVERKYDSDNKKRR